MPGCSVNAIFRVIFRTVDNSGFALSEKVFLWYISHIARRKSRF